MLALLLLIAMNSDVPMPPEKAVERWRYADHICWTGTNHAGEPVSDAETKAACISAGVLTARLMDAGYCLHPQRDVWARCE